VRELRAHKAAVVSFSAAAIPIAEQLTLAEPRVFRNAYLSVSRIKLFEQCPLAFFFRYIEKPDKELGEVDPEPAEFGNVLHDALERTYNWIRDEEYVGELPVERLLECYRLAWGDSGLVGLDLYQEGRAILRQYARTTGAVDHMRVLAVEQEFNLLVTADGCRLVSEAERAAWKDVEDCFVVNGYIDRVDRVDAETVEVVDYKSGRLLYTKSDLESDLQLSVYGLVARELFPWAKTVKLSFEMLRHGIRQRAPRSADDLLAAGEYVRAIGMRSERGPYEPRLNSYCGTCEHRTRCAAYESALARKLDLVAVSESDLATLSVERERVAKIAKAAYARRDALDAVLRARLGESEKLTVGGTTYRLAQFFDTDHDPAGVGALLHEAGIDPLVVMRVDNKALDAVLEKVEADPTIPRTVRDFLRVRIAAKSVKVPQKPRLDAKPSKR
jgi:putative RecB family exonuclease